MIASDNFPWNYAGTSFLGTGKFPFANNTTATLLSLSAQMYDALVSANPNERLLNLFPHGGFTAGTVYHPLAKVLVYFFWVGAVVNRLTTS